MLAQLQNAERDCFMPHTNFVVLTSSRTGSTWLMDLLNKQLGVEACGELFLQDDRAKPAIADLADHPRFVEVYRTTHLMRVPKVFTYLNRLYQAPSKIGFKLMYTQLRAYPEILVYMAIRRVRVIHLLRRNHIDVIVSEELARVTGRSHDPNTTTGDVPMVYLDPATLVDRIRKRSKRPGEARFLIGLTACPVLEVTYEALLEGQEEFAHICAFLNIPRPATEVKSTLAKRGTRSHKDAIINYNEVKRVLSSTRFSKMLR